MEELGIKTDIVETKGHLVVYGKVNKGGSKTLLVYNHYDVQPVDPINEWKYPPFSATISDGYVFARGASDNKGTLIARLLAFSKYKGKLNF
ncbi:MAG: M20/M25/M40 family metallo-hydrolase [Acidianus sp.]|jgi:acetylornithine deacetylase/succinyl-diaminopimelate desuccinylase-like protein|nr:M20/M25/M40 family metallo-hydrolase [Acidianus sp.]